MEGKNKIFYFFRMGAGKVGYGVKIDMTSKILFISIVVFDVIL